MSMQIMVGSKSNKEIEFSDNQRRVYITDNLKEICEKYFSEEIFFEGLEEVKYKVIYIRDVQRINVEMDNCIEQILENIKTIKGNERKNVLVEKLHDYCLLKTQIIEMLLLCNKEHDTILVLV